MVRREPGVTTLLGPHLEFVDAASTLAQYRQLFLEGAYDVPSASPAYVIDGGANVGLATLAIKRNLPDADVVAFEADPQLAEVTRRNVQAAGLLGVEVIEATVWVLNGEVTFSSDGADGGHLASDGPLKVRAVRLRDHLAKLERTVTLLKLDIEGAETDVLLDCADQLGKVERIAFEYHSLAATPQRLGAVLTLLEENGFRYSIRHEIAPERPLRDVPLFMGMDLQLNVWAWRPR